jgi:hypothetical protein
LLVEVAEGGKTSHELCLNKRRLWSSEESTSCPSTLSFSLQLPEKFSDKDGSYVRNQAFFWASQLSMPLASPANLRMSSLRIPWIQSEYRLFCDCNREQN